MQETRVTPSKRPNSCDNVSVPKKLRMGPTSSTDAAVVCKTLFLKKSKVGSPNVTMSFHPQKINITLAKQFIAFAGCIVKTEKESVFSFNRFIEKSW